MAKIKEHSLYLVISECYGAGRTALEIARAAIKGGVDIIQMREKNKTRLELIELGKNLADLCRKRGVIFIANDDPEIAKEAGADGVHLGQEDAAKYPLNMVREMLGLGKIVGISTHSIEQFSKANEDGYDYIAFGPIFPTKTKDYCLGTGDVEKVINIAKKPVFFIGGINRTNMSDILAEGAKNIALIRDILEAEDIAARTREFKRLLRDDS